MSWLFDGLFHAFVLWVPTWLWVLVILAAIGVAYRLLGFKGSIAALAAGLVLLLTIVSGKKGRQDQIKKDDQDAHDAVHEAANAREEVARKMDDPGHVYDDDGFRRD